jgi:hypothetical protein
VGGWGVGVGVRVGLGAMVADGLGEGERVDLEVGMSVPQADSNKTRQDSNVM